MARRRERYHRRQVSRRGRGRLRPPKAAVLGGAAKAKTPPTPSHISTTRFTCRRVVLVVPAPSSPRVVDGVLSMLGVGAAKLRREPDAAKDRDDAEHEAETGTGLAEATGKVRIRAGAMQELCRSGGWRFDPRHPHVFLSRRRARRARHPQEEDPAGRLERLLLVGLGPRSHRREIQGGPARHLGSPHLLHRRTHSDAAARGEQERGQAKSLTTHRAFFDIIPNTDRCRCGSS